MPFLVYSMARPRSRAGIPAEAMNTFTAYMPTLVLQLAIACIYYDPIIHDPTS